MWVQFLPGVPCPGDGDEGGDAVGDGVVVDDVVRSTDVDDVVRAAVFWLLLVAASATPAVPAAIPAASTAVMPRRTSLPGLMCTIQLAPFAAGGQPMIGCPAYRHSVRHDLRRAEMALSEHSETTSHGTVPQAKGAPATRTMAPVGAPAHCHFPAILPGPPKAQSRLNSVAPG
jgi:hypothetical protein